MVTKEEFAGLVLERQNSRVFKEKVEIGPLIEFPTAINRNTRILIVGTVAPKTSSTYFYTSPHSKMYDVLDHLLNTAMKGMKNDQESLLKALSEHNIAFLDVFERVLRKKDSSLDKDILFGTLNYDTFTEALGLLPADAVLIAVSELSFSLLKNILKTAHMEKWLGMVRYCSIFARVPNEALFRKWEEAVQAPSK